MASRVTPARAPYRNRLVPILKLIWTEVQYWMVGLTPETYHWSMAQAWEQLGDFRRAGRHFAGYLQNSENTQVRAMLAWCHTKNGSWSEAAKEYAKVLTLAKHPSLELGLAESYLELGQVENAQPLIDSVEKQADSLEPRMQEALIELKQRMGGLSSAE
jgi:thioredoxin-like negative regulator of GroEL